MSSENILKIDSGWSRKKKYKVHIFDILLYCSVSLAIHQSNIQGKMAEYSPDLIMEKGE